MKTLKNIIEPCLVALIIIALFLPYTNFLGQRITPIDFLYMDGINTLGLNIMIRLPVALLLPYIIIHFSGTHTYRQSFKLLKILFLITQFVIVTTYILVYISYGSSLYETIPAVILSITLMLISLKYAKDQRTILKNVLFSAHRAGALNGAFTEMGDIVYEDMMLIMKNLPPRLCKRAERETVGLLRSKPISIN